MSPHQLEIALAHDLAKDTHRVPNAPIGELGRFHLSIEGYVAARQMGKLSEPRTENGRLYGSRTARGGVATRVPLAVRQASTPRLHAPGGASQR